MADPDYSNIVLGDKWWPATKVYEGLVKAFGADGARAELQSAFLQENFGFACGMPTLTARAKSAYFGAGFGAIAEGRPIPTEPQTPEPGWREADPCFRREYRIGVVGGAIKAVPTSAAASYYWSLAIWFDSARTYWPRVFSEDTQAKPVEATQGGLDHETNNGHAKKGRPAKALNEAKDLIIKIFGKIPTGAELSTPDFFIKLRADWRYKEMKPLRSDDSFLRALGRRTDKPKTQNRQN